MSDPAHLQSLPPRGHAPVAARGARHFEVNGDAPFLFAAELDGTLLPNSGQLPAAACLDRTRWLLDALRAAGCPVAYVSGRHLALARTGQRAFRLPAPDYWVCNVGTEIYTESGTPDEQWSASLGPPFERVPLLNALRALPHLAMQEVARQGRHKLSLFADREPDQGLRAAVLDRARQVIGEVRLVDTREVSSGRVLLDILPAVAGKGAALGHLAAKHGLPPERVFFAGDCESDLDALACGVCATLVGNAQGPVREMASREAAARAEARVYLAERYYGDGIIEGLLAFGLLREGPDLGGDLPCRSA